MTSGSYRPALDGVRAGAVLGVIAYHVSAGKRGGFLGVDVFFVLSGYLITGLLLDERARTGTIRLGEFWARRARRLLPALLLVLLACAIVVHTQESISLWPLRRGDLLATLLYVANWHFIATDQSYFVQSAAVSPLRHMWSLGIEEQFYVVWPLAISGLLLVVKRRPAVLVALFAGAAVVSAIALALAYDQVNPSRAYFGTDTRAHELLLGAALAALTQARPGVLTAERARRLARLAWPILTAAILLTVFAATDDNRAYYYGGSFLFAAAVAALLWTIEVLPRSALGRLLSVAPLVWIGRISYGLYLWHWPVIVLLPRSQRFATLQPRVLQVLEIAATFVLATLSYLLVEQPVRRGSVPWLGRSRRRLAFVAPVAIACVGLVAWQATSLRTVPAVARAVADTSDSECPRPQSPRVDNFTWCSRTRPAGPGSAVVATAGDSISRALNPGMLAVAGARGWRYIQAGQGGCSITALRLPLSGRRDYIALADLCHAMPVILRQVQRAYDPDVWIVVDAVLRRPLLVGGTLLQPGDPRRHDPIQRALRAALRPLTANGAHVVVVGSLPPAQPIECATRKPAPSTCADVAHTVRNPAVAEVNAGLREAVGALGDSATFISIADILCPGGDVCPPLVGGVLARYDGEHFTGRFSRTIVPEIIARAQAAGVRFTRRQH